MKNLNNSIGNRTCDV